MRSIFILMCCLLAVFTELNAQECQKEYEKRFPKTGIEEVVLTNNYGKIEVVQTSGDEIHVYANMKVTAKSAAKADETMDLIQVLETRTGNYLDLKTSYGKDMAFKQFMSGLTVKVDYRVSLPKGVKLRIINSNGAVFLGNFEGVLNVDVQNGDFKAATLKGGEFYIKQSKGSFNVEQVETMTGDFKDCSIILGEGEDVRLTTNSCSGDLASIDKLNIRSSGGTIKLGDIEDLTGSSSFTKYEMQDLANFLDMEMKMGEMNIRNIQSLFSELCLKGLFTKVGLSFANNAGYQLEVKHNKSLKINLPQGWVLDERPTSERNITIGTKFVGNEKYEGKVFLELSNGSLFIQ